MLTPILPTNDWRSFENSVNDLVNGVFGKPIFAEKNSTEAGWWPRIDVLERDNAYEIHADIPGMEPKDVKLAFDSGKLTISGERNAHTESENDRVHRSERTYGKFQRTFKLPDGTNAEDITADFKHGVLAVTVPKPQASGTHEIAINISEN